MARAKNPAAGAAHYKWKGGRSIDSDGYVILNGLGRPRPIQEHIYVAEKALGKPLPRGAQVHHVNEVKADNANANLVICQDNAYHMLLHTLDRVRRAGGRPFLDKWCWMCQRPRPSETFGPRATCCKPCRAVYEKKRRDTQGKELKRRVG